MALPVEIKAAMSDLPLPLATDAAQGGVTRTGVAIAGRDGVLRFGAVPAWVWFGLCVYAIVLIHGTALLNDSDTYWHIDIGRWVLDHLALPRVDTYSFTRAGEPWISTSWLAQVLFAASFELAGWAGLIVVSAVPIAATFALLAHVLSRRIPSISAIAVAFAALMISAGHILARPYVLAWPLMLAWALGLASASERREAPSFWLLPLIALWANLHGGFVFGLVLVGAFAVDAMWNADPAQRAPLLLRWALFGIGALLACGATPYGWQSLLASQRILGLGELLRHISEWVPPDFGTLTPLEVFILALLAGALHCGVRLSPPRILLVLGLLHMTLSHVRNIEIFAILIPVVVLTPVASQFGLQGARAGRMPFPAASAAILAAIVGLSTWAVAGRANYEPSATHSPAAAVDALKRQNAKRVLNDLPFGGYLIWRSVPVFVDGRAELYGEQFEMKYYNALQLKDVNLLFELLKQYDIDAVMLNPATPAASLLDHLAGWQRIYADENAVVHLRVGDGANSLVDRGLAK